MKKAQDLAINDKSLRASVKSGALDSSLGYQIRLADLANMQYFSAAFQGSEMTPVRLTALELINVNPGIQPKELAVAMVIETSNLATTLRYLESTKLIVTQPGRDKRSKSIRLSDKGTKQMTQLHQRLQKQNERLTRHLSESEQVELIRLLKKIAAHH